MCAHPFHMHGVSFRILSNKGQPPSPAQSGWKDVVLVEELAEILVRFDRPAAARIPFMYHCHILEHEDHDMMRPFVVVPQQAMNVMDAMGDMPMLDGMMDMAGMPRPDMGRPKKPAT